MLNERTLTSDETKSQKYLITALIILTVWSGSMVGRLIHRVNEYQGQIQQLEEELQEGEKEKDTLKNQNKKLEKRLLQKKQQVKIASTTSRSYPNNACVVAMKKVFPKKLWATGAAIMKAESGQRPNAIGGPNYNGTYDYGCWQINNTKRALDPDEGTKIAWYKYNHSGWNPWTVYRTGRYRRFL